jgi:hypothetical protein
VLKCTEEHFRRSCGKELLRVLGNKKSKRCCERLNSLETVVTSIHINYILFTFLIRFVNENQKRALCCEGVPANPEN